MLADWNIPPTDPRLGKMNTARWVLAHQMQIERERRETRRWARFVGTDIAAFSENPDTDETAPVKAIPLAAILNPEAFTKLTNTFTHGDETFVEDSDFEKQAAELERGGYLTDIDSIIGEAEEKAKTKREQVQKDKENKTLDKDLHFLAKVDELTNKAEQLTKAKNKKRPRIIR